MIIEKGIKINKIGISVAIGIDILFSYIITSSGINENDYDFGEVLTKAFVTPIFTFILLWIVTLFFIGGRRWNRKNFMK
jgi:hypothetical protein